MRALRRGPAPWLAAALALVMGGVFIAEQRPSQWSFGLVDQVSDPEVRWRVEHSLDPGSNPVVGTAPGAVVIAGPQQIAAFDDADGELLWSTPWSGERCAAPVQQSTFACVSVQEPDNAVVFFDAVDGERERMDAGGFVAVTQVGSDLVGVRAANGSTEVVRTGADGEQVRWSAALDVPGDIALEPASTQLTLTEHYLTVSSVGLDEAFTSVHGLQDGTAFGSPEFLPAQGFGDRFDRMVVHETNSEGLRIDGYRVLGSRGEASAVLPGIPMLIDDAPDSDVYLEAAMGNQIRAMSQGSGDELWERSANNPIARVDGRVLLGRDEGWTAVDEQTGEELWTLPSGELGHLELHFSDEQTMVLYDLASRGLMTLDWQTGEVESTGIELGAAQQEVIHTTDSAVVQFGSSGLTWVDLAP